MKIQIELEEVEKLKAELQATKEKLQEAKEKLSEISEETLKQKAVNLSWRLFDNYMSAVFIHLGFNEPWNKQTVRADNLEHWVGKEWWKSGKIEIEVCANVTTKFREAFLRIGVITQPKEEVKEDQAYNL